MVVVFGDVAMFTSFVRENPSVGQPNAKKITRKDVICEQTKLEACTTQQYLTLNMSG